MLCPLALLLLQGERGLVATSTVRNKTFMTNAATERLLRMYDERHELEDYQGGLPRWCAGCGDNAILAAVQRLCRDENLRPEKTVFVSGIGCSSRFPHYMKTYGFHGIHGRALPLAEGIKMVRPDLDVFVNTGDGDCCSIGAAHWIHAVRYNMNMTVILHDNQVYGLTKKQASPTSPKGMKSNTTPRGAWLDALQPLTVTLGVQNVSFAAQAVDWMPEALYAVIRAAFHHKGFSFVRVVQRCPEWLPDALEPWVRDPLRILILTHDNGIRLSPAAAKIYRNQKEHDPSDIHGAREIASSADPIPVGVLYRNPGVPCYEDLRRPEEPRTTKSIRAGLESEFDKFTVWPPDMKTKAAHANPQND
jgi:2-oxoglutarate ferredoxin oxidoreductase subunit beta